jgi:transcriptional regulator with XRE-family HTH domain
MDTMKIDVAFIKQLREQRAWPQEQLAAVAGLSLRTIQRVEADGNASAETRMAIATALDVDVARLNLPDPPPSTMPALPATNFKFSLLQYRMARFLILGALLLGLDFYVSGTITWSLWVLLFWGVLLLLRIARRTLVEPESRTRI